MQRGMANPVCVLIMENNLHILRLARWLATEEINCGARITSITMITSDCPASSPFSGIIWIKSMPRNCRAECSLFLFRADSDCGLAEEPEIDSEIIRQRSDNDTFRGVKTRPICLNVSGIKRGTASAWDQMCPSSSPDISQCYRAL